MMTAVKLLAALALVFALAAARPAWAQEEADGADAGADDTVLALEGEEAFSAAIAAHDVLLVEFYAPWCGHCKKLEPEYDAAAKALAKDGSGLRIAKVDADNDANKKLAQDHGVRGFPTLKLFRNGAFASDYEGARDAAAIESFVRKQAQPALTLIAAEADALAFGAKDRVTLVGCFESDSSDEFLAFSAVAEGLRNDFTFGAYVAEGAAAVCGQLAEGATFVALTKDFDDGNVAFSGDATDELALTEFARTESVPLVDEIGPHNYKLYSESKQPLGYIFVAKTDEDQVKEFTDRFGPIAKETKGKMNWVWIDSVQYGRHGERLGLSGSVFPAVAIERFDDGTHYAYPEDGDLSFEPVNEWVTKFVAGDLEPTVKSENEPTEEERAARPVHKIVARTFERDVIQADADVFVEFYAPWCGHCKKLAPTWEKLAKDIAAMGASDKVRIADIDATANDVEAKYGVRGFPTLKYFKKGVEAPLDYSGDRSEADLIKFIKEHSTDGVEVVSADAEDVEADPEEKDEL